MITRQMSLEYGLAYQIAKWGFGEHIIVAMTTRMACRKSVRSSYIRVEFDSLVTLEITGRSDRSYMSVRLSGENRSVVRDLLYVSGCNCVGNPELATQPEELYQGLRALVMSMFDDVAGGGLRDATSRI